MRVTLIKNLLSAGVAAMLLSGCAIPVWDYSVSSRSDTIEELPYTPIQPPRQAQFAFSATAKGTQMFRCTKDSRGLYWKFLAPKATLSGPKKQPLIFQGAKHAFLCTDKSRLTASIISSGGSLSTEDLRDILYATKSVGKKGKLSDIRWVIRRHARGGVPLTQCSASQAGMVLNVRYSAKYDFYQ